MSRIPYTNPLDVAVYIGGVCVPARGTRTVDGALLPPAAALAPPSPEHPLLALAGGSVKAIVAAIPDLADDDLDQLIEIERAGKDRSTLVEALELAKLERVDQREQADAAAKEAAAAEAAAGTAGEPQA